MKKKKAKRKQEPSPPSLSFEWKGSVRYCKTRTGNEFPYQRRSKKYPNESEYMQMVRLTYDIPDNVDLTKILSKTTEERETWHGRQVYDLGKMPSQSVFTVVGKTLTGRVVKVKEHKVVYRKHSDGWGFQGKKYKLPPDTKVVHGNPFAPVEPSPKTILVAKPHGEVGPTVTFKDSPTKTRKVTRDRFGAKIDSEAAKINAVLDVKPKTELQIKKEAKTDRNVHSHLAGLVRKGFVKKFRGKKTGRILYKVKEA